MWIKGGPYIANMWSENLTEWSKRNPEINKIMVAEITDKKGEHVVGLVVDRRVDLKWLNKELCITGHGFGSKEIQKEVENWWNQHMVSRTKQST